VIARNGVISDWLATACSILPIDEALELVGTIDGAALLITEMDNGKLVQKSSENFKDYFEN
jgi:thiamine biosynthesis lipoprotein